jgi:hypothetical protein
MRGAADGRSAGCIDREATADLLASISPERRCFMRFSSIPPRDGMSSGSRAWSVLTDASKRVYSLARDSGAKATSSVVSLDAVAATTAKGVLSGADFASPPSCVAAGMAVF